MLPVREEWEKNREDLRKSGVKEETIDDVTGF